MVRRMEKWCQGALMCALLAVSAWGAAQPVHAHSAKPVPVASGVNYPGVLRLHVDATDLDHRIFRIQQTVPVAPGALTLHYPRFLPGTHGPYGEIERLAGLHIEARGQRHGKRDS